MSDNSSNLPAGLTVPGGFMYWSQHGTVDENAHLVSVSVNRGGEITTVTENGTTMSAGKPSERGVRVEIKFRSEQGRTFTHAYQFHKGDTQFKIADVNEAGDPSVPENVIWRG